LKSDFIVCPDHEGNAMITILFILASVSFVSMMSPGPDMMLIVKHSCAREPWPVVACIAGTCSGLSVHIAFSILGLAAIISTSATIYSVMKLAGAGYLIYLGVKSLLSNEGLALDKTEKSVVKKRATPFRDGFFCNVLNPKVTIYILAVFTQVIGPETSVVDKVLYGLFIEVEAFFVWNVFAALVRTKLVLGMIQRFKLVIDRTVGVILIGFGIALALEK
jgi:threonine efflux protein